MQSIVDKLSTPNSFLKAIQKWKNVLQKHAVASSEDLLDLEIAFVCLSKISLKIRCHKEPFSTQKGF